MTGDTRITETECHRLCEKSKVTISVCPLEESLNLNTSNQASFR